MYIYSRSPTSSPEPMPPYSPLARSRREDGICVTCHQAGDCQRPLITAPCSCLMHIPCAMTFVENHLISWRAPSNSRVVSCPNPAMHESRRDVFWPRILELVDVAIPVWYNAGNERGALQARVATANERLRTARPGARDARSQPDCNPRSGHQEWCR